jgi:putative nucleotidyltransferase with HDIG domain
MNIKKKKKSLKKFLDPSDYFRWGVLSVITILFIVILYPSLAVIKHSYKLGDVAKRDIKAPKDFFIEDMEATERKHKQALEGVLTVYDHDTTLLRKLTQHVNQAFADLRVVFKAETKDQIEATSKTAKVSLTWSAKEKPPVHDLVWQMKKNFEEKSGLSVSKGAYKILEKEKFSKSISNFIIQILSQILENGVVSNKDILMRESDKGVVLRSIGTKKEKVVRNLKQFYGLDQSKTMVRIIGQPLLKDHNYILRNLIVDFVQSLIQPNITLNRSETEERKKKIASEIKPILYKIKAGEMLLREGERVTDLQLLKLEAIQAQTKKGQIFASSIGAAMILVCLLVTTYLLHMKQQNKVDHDHHRNLIFIGSVFITFLFLVKISASFSEFLAPNTLFPISASSIYFGIPLASGAMTICIFLGLNIAVPFAVVISACTAIIFQSRFEIFIYFFISNAMAAYWVQNCRERKIFIKAGAKLGLLNVVLSTAIGFYIAEYSGLKFLWDWSFAFMGGIVAGIFTAGIVPLAEIAFDYKTDITLLELANLDRPILHRLMIEAPGTYHHSVIVGSMVEAAASEIDANPLLSKVCGYYHDIGKIKKPLYFIENQTNGKNRHDKLAPSMSSLILQAHIKDGVEIAKENKLGRAIIDAIKQSHGTSIISFFYEKAKRQKGKDKVKIDDYRYSGPKPKTKEAGLVMIADVVEAASKTLNQPTPSRIQGLVQDLINKVFSDGQLDDCGFTLKDLHNIAKSFNKILNGIYHHRIEYSNSHVSNNGKGKDGSHNRQQAKEIQDTSEKNRANNTGHLKRLGLS